MRWKNLQPQVPWRGVGPVCSQMRKTRRVYFSCFVYLGRHLCFDPWITICIPVKNINHPKSREKLDGWFCFLDLPCEGTCLVFPEKNKHGNIAHIILYMNIFGARQQIMFLLCSVNNKTPKSYARDESPRKKKRKKEKKKDEKRCKKKEKKRRKALSSYRHVSRQQSFHAHPASWDRPWSWATASVVRTDCTLKFWNRRSRAGRSWAQWSAPALGKRGTACVQMLCQSMLLFLGYIAVRNELPISSGAS